MNIKTLLLEGRSSNGGYESEKQGEICEFSIQLDLSRTGWDARVAALQSPKQTLMMLGVYAKFLLDQVFSKAGKGV